MLYVSVWWVSLMYRTRSGSSAKTSQRHSLSRRGCLVLARNIRADGGEIDLVVSDGTACVAIEVKTTSHGSDPADAVDDRKLALLERTASSLGMAINRIDIVAVTLSPNGIEVRWLRAVD